MATFTKDVEEIRQRAMKKIEDGAVIDSYKLDKDKVLEILNEALATEIVCVLRYQHHYFMATGVHGRSVAGLFKEHADEEREHADEIADRIQQLGGKPNFNPGDLVRRSVAQYVEGETLADMIREDLIAERTVIEVYQRMIEFFGEKDPTTRRLIEHIKGEEEEHASELSDMMFIVNPETGKDEGQDPGTNPLQREEGGSRGGRRTAFAGSRGHESMPKNASSMAEDEADESEEVAMSRHWGNEANVGKLGKGSPVRRSTAPEESGWGNEVNVGRSEGRGQSLQAEEASRNSQTRETMAKNISGTKRNAQTTETTRPAGRGMDRSGNNKKNTNITNRPDDERVTPRASRGGDISGQTEKQKKLGGGKIPGVGGRTMNRRKNEKLNIDIDDVAERPNRGASSGTNKSPRILQKNRKSKRAA
jgi:bacterioferritin